MGVPVGWSRAAAGERIYDRIEARTRILSVQPRLGPRRGDVRPSMRVLVESPYLIFYETIPDTDSGPVEKVEIVRVVDGRRDLPRLF